MWNPIYIFNKWSAWVQVYDCPVGCFFMQNKKKCKCGSFDVVYVVQKGRSKKLDFFCSDCLPVEAIENTEHKKQRNLADSQPALP